jgi:hypothetical protein
MEKKQTAVEWLVNHITEDQIIKAKSMYEWLEIFEQAKQMEKEQIEMAMGTGFNDGCAYMYDGKPEFKNPEHYYNET